MKISERVIRFALIFLIALSLVLSYNIWLSPASKGEVATSGNSVVADTKNYRKESDSFLPLRLIYTKNGSAQGTQSENVISQIQSKLTSDVSAELRLVVNGSEKTFEGYKKLSNGFELIYEGNFLLSDFLDIYNFDISNDDTADGFYFTRVQVDFDQKKVNFMNYKAHEVYQLTFTGLEDTYENIISEKGVDLTNMTNSGTINERQYNTSETISLKKYSYILSTQAFTLFRNAFFQDPSSVNSDNTSVYSSGQERLEIDPDRQMASFKGVLALDEEMDDIYEQSFSYIRKLGTSVGNLRYFDRTSDQVNYRVFVEGYPVFGDLSRGVVQITVDDSIHEDAKAIQIVTSTNTIQVPIPADEVVELPSTEVVQKKILEAGAEENKMGSILIGYTWQTVKETNRVVDLTPEWYVLYDGEWYSETQLIHQLSEQEVD